MDASFSPKGRTSERVEMELSAGHQDCRSLAAAVDANVDRLVGPIGIRDCPTSFAAPIEAQAGASSSREATCFNSPRRSPPASAAAAISETLESRHACHSHGSALGAKYVSRENSSNSEIAMITKTPENKRRVEQPVMHTPPVVSPEAWEAARQ